MDDKQLYQKTFEAIKPSSKTIDKLISQLESNEQKERHFYRRQIAWYRKKAAVIIILACLMLGTTSVAAYTIKKASLKNVAYEYYNDIEKLQLAANEKLSFDFRIIEEFDNQFEFLDGGLVDIAAYDEKGSIFGEKKALIMQYGVSGKLKYRDLWGQEEIRIIVAPLFDYQKEKFSNIKKVYEVKQILEKEVYYAQLTVKFVPENYEITKEDEDAIKKGELHSISKDDSLKEPKLIQVSDCFWIIDGDIVCEMEEKESTMDSEEWFSMAEQIIRIQDKTY